MTQKERLKAVFELNKNKWIPLPEILRLGIAQYNARIHELRRDGMHIANKIESANGQKHTWFMYISQRAQGSGVLGVVACGISGDSR